MTLLKTHLIDFKSIASGGLRVAARAGIKVYQAALSPIFGGRCRYYPSCSHYALECFEKHSFGRALALALARILRCHPLGSEGFDPVPEVK